MVSKLYIFKSQFLVDAVGSKTVAVLLLHVVFVLSQVIGSGILHIMIITYRCITRSRHWNFSPRANHLKWFGVVNALLSYPQILIYQTKTITHYTTTSHFQIIFHGLLQCMFFRTLLNGPENRWGSNCKVTYFLSILQIRKFENFRESFNFAKLRICEVSCMRSFVKIKLSRNGESTLSFYPLVANL